MGVNSYRELAKEVLERWRQGRTRRVSLPGVAQLLRPAARGRSGGDQRLASGRERHTQKITVSAEELLDLERARLALLRYGAAADGAGSSARRSPSCSPISMPAARTAYWPAGSPMLTAPNRSMPTPDTTPPGQLIRGLARTGYRHNREHELLNPLAGDDSAARASAPSRCTWTCSRGRSTCCCALISKHKLNITEVALSQVTDEFIAFILGALRPSGPGSGQLLPDRGHPARPEGRPPAAVGEVEDEEDLALLEARMCVSPGFCTARTRTRRSRPSSRPG